MCADFVHDGNEGENPMKIHLSLLLVAGVLTVITAFAQKPMPKNWDANMTMTNEEVKQLVGTGVPERFVVAKIRSAKSVNFDTSPSGLKALSDAGIPDSVIEAMIGKQDAGKVDTPIPAASTVSTGPADPNNPMTLHDAGVYYLKEGKMVEIEAGTFQGEKHTSMLKMMATQGFSKYKDKALLPGAKAPTQIADTKPTFYFYFGKDESPTMVSFSPDPKTPREYLLVKLEVSKSDRRLETMEAGMGGANMNATTKNAVKFSYTKIGLGAYKVTPDSPLDSGEYCFFAGSGTMGQMAAMGRVYDFGISSGK